MAESIGEQIFVSDSRWKFFMIRFFKESSPIFVEEFVSLARLISGAAIHVFTWPEMQISVFMGIMDLCLLNIFGFRLIDISIFSVFIMMAYCFLSYFIYEKEFLEKKNARLAMSSQSMLGIGIFIAFNATAEILDYILTGTIVLPEWDQRFAAWDAMLGFHYLAYYHFVQGIPWLSNLLRLVYGLVILEILFMMIVLPLSGHVRKARWFMLWYVITGMVTIVIGVLMPARGAFVYYHLPIALHTSYVPVMAGLRDGTLRTVNFVNAQGLVFFPSFHAILATLSTAAGWSFKYLKYPFLVFNVLVIFSAPIDGGHYGVDVLAGITIALITIYLVRPNRTAGNVYDMTNKGYVYKFSTEIKHD